MKPKIYRYVLSIGVLIGIIFSAASLTGMVFFNKFSFKTTPLSIATLKDTYYHHEFIEFEAKITSHSLKNTLITEGLDITILFNDAVVTGIGGRTILHLIYNKKKKAWYGAWPCPWNASEGKYKAAAVRTDIEYLSKPFSIAQRKISPISPGMAVMTYETNDYLSSLHPPLLKGGTGNWQDIFEWCEFTNVDGLWLLSGQTAYFSVPLAKDFPWLEHNLEFLSTFGQAAHKRGLFFGAYVMAYLTFGKQELKPQRYEYAIDYEYQTDTLFETRSVSLRDTQRKKDIIDMLVLLKQVEEIDYIGLDYIRNALGGFELVDEFVSEMQVDVPDTWTTMKRDERMRWLGRKKVLRKDMKLIDQWQWWRAHLVGTLVEEIKREVNSKKPLWVFTLSWECGWQHGQDPVMMNDAGADIDAIMLYEADKDEYQDLLKHWRTYVRKDEANLIVGDVIDWNLHQKTLNPAGPEEYMMRNKQAIEQIYIDGPSKGVFLHDLNRFFWGRRGPYSRLEWALAGAYCVALVKDAHHLNSLSMNLTVPDTVELYDVFFVTLSITTSRVFDTLIQCELFYSDGIGTNIPLQWMIDEVDKEYSRSITMRSLYANNQRANRHFIAVRAEWLEEEKKKSYSTIQYFNVNIPEQQIGEQTLPITAGMFLNEYVVIRSTAARMSSLTPHTTNTAGQE